MVELKSPLLKRRFLLGKLDKLQLDLLLLLLQLLHLVVNLRLFALEAQIFLLLAALLDSDRYVVVLEQLVS